MPKVNLNANQLADQLLAGNRRALAKAITLVESQQAEHQAVAHQVLDKILPHTGKAKRVGISGSPGVGKSTFIENLGMYLTQTLSLKVAVLAIDPSSPRAGGSILGDKTRMEQLARESRAFIRPSPAGRALGGVASNTAEAILLCEAAGYDVCMVETVGVGQSEHMVANMVDFFLLLLLPSAGDELQGIKRGIIELIDGLVVTKADADQAKIAQVTQQHYQNALTLLQFPKVWQPRVLTSSREVPDSIVAVWQMLESYWQTVGKQALAEKRSEQNKRWLHYQLEHLIRNHLNSDSRLNHRIRELESEVLEGKRSAFHAAHKAFDALFKR